MRIPKRTDASFEFGSLLEWHSKGRGVSQFFNSLSPFFPDGERFFIDAVRHYRGQIDSELREAVIGFMGQEAVHGREHRKFDEEIAKTGFNALAVEAGVGYALKKIQLTLPPSHCLAITISLEHITAILAEQILSDPSLVWGDDGAMNLWLFHALEEHDHRSVAFDVYEECVGSYPLRATYLIISTIVFVAAVYAVMFYAMYATKCGPKEWLKFFRFQFGRRGFFWRVVIPWLRWFNPKFHPEQQ